MDAEKQQSKLIDFLRFPLIVGVVLQHTRVRPHETSGLFWGIETLFSKILAHVSVPLFFFIAGYLFFYKTNFGRQVYYEKLRRRTSSLFVPYVFWISAWLVGKYALIQTGFIGREPGIVYNFDFIARAYWACEEDNGAMYPFVGQFWFIRDLMVVTLCTPAFYFCLKNLKLFFVLFCGVCWWLDLRIPFVGDRGLSHWAFFFFSFGAWFSVNKKVFMAEFEKLRIFSFIVYPALVIADLFLRGRGVGFSLGGSEFDIGELVHRSGIIAGILFFVNLSALFLHRGKIGNNSFLPAASFFVFAAHGPGLLLFLEKFALKPLNPQSDLALTACYFAFLFAVLGITLGLYAVMRSYFPVFTRIITGGHSVGSRAQNTKRTANGS
ncbi:MAG: acyltransferase [Puniceicoccales bacterium]|nr:acyltransferase [Puniceicoccales bacterium]